MIVVMAILWTIAGFILVATVGAEMGPLFGFRHMEGSSAIFGVLFAAPIGAIGGAILGIWLARRYANDPRKRAIAAGIPLMGFAAIGIAILVDDIMSREPVRHVYAMFTIELRLPSGMPAPAAAENMLIELRHDKPDQTIKAMFYPGDWDRRRNGDRVVVQGLIDTWVRNTNRTIAVRAGEGPTYLFKISEPPEPSDKAFSDWRTADSVQPEGAPSRIDFRYKVDKKY